MSEAENKPKERGIPDIQTEYQQCCVKAGHLQYQIATMGKDLGLLNDTMRDLNFEAAGLQAKQQAAKPAESAPAPEASNG